MQRRIDELEHQVQLRSKRLLREEHANALLQVCVCICVRVCVRVCMCVCAACKRLLRHEHANALAGERTSRLRIGMKGMRGSLG